MRTLARWAALLYPAAWRARYGAEMEALVEDVGPRGGDLWDIVRGALVMRMTSLSVWKILTGCALAGVVAAGIWSVVLPGRYVSTAVMRMGGEAPSLDQLQAVEQRALSRASLAEIILRPSLNLYPNERKRLPLEDVVEQMRSRDLRIRHVDRTTFAVQFASEDPAAAQAAVQAIVSRLIEQNLQAGLQEGSVAANMEVLDPASLPSQPEGPDRLRMVRNGLFSGLALGLLCAAIFSIVRRKEQWSLRRIGGFAAAGMALGVTVAFLVPNEFKSTAVLRTADASKLQAAIAQVLSDDSLAAIVRDEDLFARERSRTSMHDVALMMRNQRIRIQTVQLPQSARWAAFTVSVQYTDPRKAQQVTHDLVTRFITPYGAPPSATEVLDPASYPQAPSSPNRAVIAALCTLAGILLGLGASRFRRPKLATA